LWLHHAEFVREFPDLNLVSDQLYIVDGNRCTCAGGTSVTHLAAHLIERRVGRAQATQCLRIMVEDNLLPATSPQPQAEFTIPTNNVRLRRAMRQIEQYLGTPFSLRDIAKAAHSSVRQLQRDFRHEIGMSPVQFIVQVRLRHAQWMLIHTRRSITEIADRCGFGTGARLSQAFRRAFDQSPRAFRSAQPHID